MMKNTEWGAVAYLSHSKYGNMNSIRINNNNMFVTGYSSIEEPTLSYNKSVSIEGNRNEAVTPENDGNYAINYLNISSIVSSSTGNYSGIYDMSGGAWEYVMGILLDKDGKPLSGLHNIWNSGFKGTYGCPTCNNTSGVDSNILENTTGISFPEDNRYFDLYSNSSFWNKYNTRILGDATGEMGPFYQEKDLDGSSRNKAYWYGDHSNFLLPSGPWFVRGGHWSHGSASGIFAFGSSYGNAGTDVGFRVVLTPTE